MTALYSIKNARKRLDYDWSAARTLLHTHAPAVVWQPTPNSPQERAYHSEADELFYGGAAGGGKTDLLLGLAGTQHHRSVIFRRTFPLVRSLVERSRDLFNVEDASRGRDSYNESLHIWRLASGSVIEFDACQFDKDKEKQRGRPRDFYGFDEVTEFTEAMYRFITAWNRSTTPGQRCRVVVAGNPPTSADGAWVVDYWGPWLNPDHPLYPLPPGDLCWYARIDDADVIVDAAAVRPGFPATCTVDGVVYPVRSRTFIPARLDDNPYLRDTSYGAILASLPEPLRSQMLYGSFALNHDDDPWQVIPTAWVQAAMQRWRELEPPAAPLGAVGVDVAHGGADQTVIARRYGSWVAPLLKYAGADTPTGQMAAQKVIEALAGATVRPSVDGIGYGASCVDALHDRAIDAVAVNVGAGTSHTDATGTFRFVNLRSALYWRLREALDPHTSDLALPDDRELLGDLCAPRYSLQGGRIAVESKDAIRQRIGRSPDCGDAVLLLDDGLFPVPAPRRVAVRSTSMRSF